MSTFYSKYNKQGNIKTCYSKNLMMDIHINSADITKLNAGDSLLLALSCANKLETENQNYKKRKYKDLDGHDQQQANKQIGDAK
ncbi:hypothetical protein RJT34_08187 [Clitoria ternatea]|uniref:Uncharacterized protein n=1 Tax=Clitoria ternatea TaxID=43366 RepID=A0AAN9PUF3_CLITE